MNPTIFQSKSMVLILSMLVFGLSNAQNSNIGNWVVYNLNSKISPKLDWASDVQYRSFDLITDMSMLVARTGLGYNLTENNNNVLVGYAFFRSLRYKGDTNEKEASTEHRLHQQFVTRQNFGRINLQHRYRLEERFFDDNRFKLRFRYRIGMIIPLNHNRLIEDTFYTHIAGELFLHHKNPVFDQNRLFGAIGFVFNKSLRGEIGFMTQAFEGGNRINQLQVIFRHNISFKSKNENEIEKVYESMELIE